MLIRRRLIAWNTLTRAIADASSSGMSAIRLAYGSESRAS